MRLSKLTLSGFKSFADTTEFTFDDVITGIVGPNGCGKSNVVDAVKWVLGERSSKSLRGTEMLDVIFAGSAGRRPGGMASVTLTFENPLRTAPVYSSDPSAATTPDTAEERPESDEEGDSVVDASVRARRGLPIDADVVEVERRLYRDGTSQYLINGRKARLRDIRELFLDTGIGADAYSIIEQGKVDAMLLASPQERRTIFEEAAGVAKYKQRRIEAQRKLEKAQANLVQTREQLDSTERRLRIVKGQAVKARRFKELDEQLRAWRTALALDQYDVLAESILSLTATQLRLDDQRVNSSAVVTGVESDKQDADLKLQEVAAELRGLEQQQLEAEHLASQASQRAQMTERAIAESARRAEQDASRLAEQHTSLGDVERSLETHGQQVSTLTEEVARADRALAAATEERSAALSLMNERQAAASERRSAMARIDRERAGLAASAAADEKRVDAAQEQIDGFLRRLSGQQAELVRIAGETSGLRSSSEATRVRVEALQAEVTHAESRMEELGQGRRELARHAGELDQELARLDSRRTTLLEMVESRVGYGEAVQKVLARRDAGEGFAGVLGALVDLIRTPSEHAGLVEAALGASLQSLVLEHAGRLPNREELESLPGRVTFVPARGGPGAEPVKSGDRLLEMLSGRVRAVRSLVEASAETRDHVEPVLDRLLGTTFAVDTLDTASMLAAGPMAGCRFVTSDGSVLEADGRVFAGPISSGAEGTGVLARKNELEQLTLEVASLRDRAAAKHAELAAADAEAASLSTIAAQKRAQLAAEQRQFLAEQGKLERLAADETRVQREIRGLDQEIGTLRERLAKLESERKATHEKAESLARLHAEQATQLAGFEDDLRQAQQRVEVASEQATAARVDASRASEQLGAARREASRLANMRDELTRQIAFLAAEIERTKAAEEERRATLEESKVAAEQHAARAAELGASIDESRRRSAEAEAEVSAIARRLVEARREAADIEKQWANVEMSRREAEIRREAIEDRIREELSLDLPAIHPEYRELIASGGVARPDHDEAQRSIDELKDLIRKLGNVNLDSIEEETQLETRNEELIRQVADIDDACRKLSELIEQLNAVSRERFAESFTKTQEHFGGEQGMFRRLFGGGKAEIRLMPLVKEINGEKVQTDEVDILESGIEIIAKPPGKEPRSISQLSGGEKTLTAVALLMAIFRSKPSCFCVLDEVDAALDEANVARFNNVVRQFTDRSHFIVITHNKRTMQSADRLYGVTMQERGVSKRVSVNFSQLAADGSIREASPEPAPTTPSAVVPADEPSGESSAERPGYLRRALAAMREDAIAPADRS